jgi:arylformamidase
MQDVFDISLPITEDVVVWPGDPKPTIRQLSSIEEGHSSNLSQIRMSVHTGTHIDAPRHFLEDGKTVGEIPLEKLIGKALVAVLPDSVSLITKAVLQAYIDPVFLRAVKMVLLRTRNSTQGLLTKPDFDESYVALDTSGAQFLANFDLDLVGVDYLSVAAYQDTTLPHQILLKKEIVLLEGITLADVPEGIYNLTCLPLNLVTCEGAPARAILSVI